VGWISEVKKIEAHLVIVLLLVFLSTIAPGFLLLFRFKPELLEKLDSVKLVLLAISLTLPVLVVNVVSVMFVFFSAVGSGRDLKVFVLGGCVVTVIAFYGALLGAYLESWTFVRFLASLFGVDVAILIWLKLMQIADNKGWKLPWKSKPNM
jgi:hypothetical protein